jgi:hypothetical protein
MVKSFLLRRKVQSKWLLAWLGGDREGFTVEVSSKMGLRNPGHL